MTTPSREIEFKFGVRDRHAFDRLVEHLNLAESVLSEGVSQVNHFFDSQGLCLHNKHSVIRLREEKDKNILTIKSEHALQQNSNSVLSDRVEEEVALPRQAAVDLLHGVITPQQAIKDYFKTRSAPILQMIETACHIQEMVHIGQFSNVRIHLPTVSLALDGTREKVVFELDTSTFPDGSVEHEIEVEITQHIDAESIETALLDLLQRAGIEWHTAKSKAARFFDALGRLPDTD